MKDKTKEDLLFQLYCIANLGALLAALGLGFTIISVFVATVLLFVPFVSFVLFIIFFF